MIAGGKQTVEEFVLFEPESSDEVFKEFNSLSVMYSQPVRCAWLSVSNPLSPSFFLSFFFFLQVSHALTHACFACLHACVVQSNKFILQDHPYDLLGQPDATIARAEEGDDDDEDEDEDDELGTAGTHSAQHFKQRCVICRVVSLIQNHRVVCTQTHTDTHTQTHTHTGRQAGRQTDRQTDTHTQTHTHTLTHPHPHRHTQTHRHPHSHCALSWQQLAPEAFTAAVD